MITPEKHKEKFTNSFIIKRQVRVQAILRCVQLYFEETPDIQFPCRIKLEQYKYTRELAYWVDITYNDLELVQEAVELVNKDLKSAGWPHIVVKYDCSRWYRTGYIIIDKDSMEF